MRASAPWVIRVGGGLEVENGEGRACEGLDIVYGEVVASDQMLVEK